MIDFELKFDESGLIPAIVQDASTGEVLMLAHMDKEAFKRTLETGRSWFWSRSRNEYWQKGETSGNFQYVKEIRYDCDQDSLLLLVEPVGPACHTGQRSCFYRKVEGLKIEDLSLDLKGRDGGLSGELDELYRIIAQRKRSPSPSSYTASLFAAGEKKILGKIEEEADEVIDAALNKDDSEVVWEVADLLYHLLVLLAARGIELSRVKEELSGRKK
ncbi:MAG: bifunctional phosphoribosyl-AMP cyclohydrolase/phosphoribosyl-ATP diphosphatase HisIE [Actinomycetota bacterium]|nr:bifunctional phosphoribosyl-AMP cyclohydrolase/phosphoribosyl-ATP diphosphatase HisIE [Actinomycetota bacterium]